MTEDISDFDQYLVTTLLPKGLANWEEINELITQAQGIYPTQAKSDQLQAQKQLVNLWRYSLLKITPVSLVNNYPVQIFEAMTALGWVGQAIGLINLLPLTYRKVEILVKIAVMLHQTNHQSGNNLIYSPLQLLLEASRLALVLPEAHSQAVGYLVEGLTELGEITNPTSGSGYYSTSQTNNEQQTWLKIWENTAKLTRCISNLREHLISLGQLGVALYRNGQIAAAKDSWQELRELVASSPKNETHALRGLVETLVKINQWELAHSIASLMAPDPNKVRALVALFEAYLKVGETRLAKKVKKEVLSVASLLTAEPLQVYAIRELALSLSKAGNPEVAAPLWQQVEKALRQVKVESDPWIEEHITDLIYDLAQAGQWNAARRIETSLSVPYWQVKAQRELAYLQAIQKRESPTKTQEDWVKAEEATLALTDPADRAKASRKLVGLLAKAAEWERAEKVARTISFAGIEKAFALELLARELLQAGQPERAFEIASGMTPHPNLRESLARLAGQFARAGYWELALKLADKGSRFIKVELALSLIIIEFCRAGQYERARANWVFLQERLLNNFGENYNEGAVLQELSGLLVSSEQFERATTIIKQIKNDQQKAKAWIELARELELRGNSEAEEGWKQAEEVVNHLEDDWNNPKAASLNKLASTLVECNKSEKASHLWAKAIELAVAYPDATFHDHGLKEISSELLKWGQWQKAEEVMRHSWHGTSVNQLLKVLAGWLSNKEEWQEAERVALSIEGSLERAEALAELAKALAKCGEWEAAERIVALMPTLNTSGSKSEDNKASTLVVLAHNTQAMLSELRLQTGTEAETAPSQSEVILHWQKAIEQALNEPYDFNRGKQLVNIVEEMDKAGRWQDAEKLLESLPDELIFGWYDYRSEAREKLVKTLCEQGLWKEAQVMTFKIKEKRYRSAALQEVLKGLLSAELGHTAWELWQSTETELPVYTDKGYIQNFEELAKLAQSLAKAGYWQPLLEMFYTKCLKVSTEQELFSLIAFIGTLTQNEGWKELSWHFYEGLSWVNTITYQLLQV